jgi:hypothetical protein
MARTCRSGMSGYRSLTEGKQTCSGHAKIDVNDPSGHLTGGCKSLRCLLTGPRELDILRCDPGSLRVRCNSIS